MTALGGPLILLAIIALGWAFAEGCVRVDGWLHGGDGG